MKKLLVRLIVTLSVILFLALPAHAGQMLNTILAATTLTKGTSDQTVTLATNGMRKLVIFVDYTPDAAVAENLTFTLDVSYDGTNWVDANFYDFSGGATLQTSETLATDAWYYAYWENRLSVPFVRIRVVGDSSWDDSSGAEITLYTVQTR